MMGCAKVINYAGIVRGGSQQLIKLEMNNYKNDPLITRIDGIIDSLKNGGGVYDLMKIEDRVFRVNIKNTAEYWETLKEQIFFYREHNTESSILLQMSETFFSLSDNLVFTAQSVSEKLTFRQNLLEAVLTLIIFLNLLILGKQSYDGIKFSRMAYTDKHTRLPNKSRCEEYINDNSVLDDRTAFIMFDLNYLKKINDTLGHAAGDSMILNFATTLRKAIPPKHFVGRFGGDEFISILWDVSENDIKDLMSNIQAEINKFNEFSNQVDISFAYGYSHSGDYTECTMNTLLEKADLKMYEYKEQQHAVREGWNKI